MKLYGAHAVPLRKYQGGMKKDDYWAYALEDCLDVIATWQLLRGAVSASFLLDVCIWL